MRSLPPCLLVSLLTATAHGGEPPPYETPALPLGYFHARYVSVEVDGADRLARVRDRIEGERDAVASADGEPLSNDKLAALLRDRLKGLAGYDERSLRLRIAILDAAHDEEKAETRVHLSLHAYDGDGRELAVAPGTSTLIGHTGGMSRRVGEHLELALFDAFDRAVRRDDFMSAVNAALDGAGTTRVVPGLPAQAQMWAVGPHESSGMAHVLGVTFDAGANYAFGARYLHEHIDATNGLLWAGYGGEARLVTIDGDRVDALAALAVARAGMWMEQGISVEAGLGVGGRDAVSGIAIAGVFVSFYYVDLGLSLQFPVGSEQPGWITIPHFGARVHIPVKAHGRVLRCRSPERCEHGAAVFD